MGFYSHHDHEGETQDSPCTYVYATRSGHLCGASWDSALHPPDQYRHWCAALEAGGDCTHEEAGQ